MLLETGRDQVGSDGCSPHRMLLDTGRYQVMGMLLEIGRCQVGSDGCSPPSDASRHRTLPGWQGWRLAPDGRARIPSIFGGLFIQLDSSSSLEEASSTDLLVVLNALGVLFNIYVVSSFPQTEEYLSTIWDTYP